MKKYSQNKIEADNLIKQVRQRIKETTWEKQNLREGFTETFKPLISQFEDPGKDSKTQNIFTQNQKMLQNQLALTQGIRNNQLALKGIKDQQGHFNRALEYLENLADMEELTGERAIKDEEDEQAHASTPSPLKTPISTPTPQAEKKPIVEFDVAIFDSNLSNKKSIDILDSYGHSHLPSFYFDKNINDLTSLISDVKVNLEDTQKELSTNIEYEQNGAYTLVKPKAQNPRQKTIEGIDNYNTLSIYLTNLNYLYQVKQKQTGSGLFNSPQELIRRFELLKGSLIAGNNGVLPELIKILHRLRDLGILSNKKLNTFLRKVI